MAKTETLHIRVNERVKYNAEETLNKLGISISDAVNMFLCQVELTGGLPFEVKLPAPQSVIVSTKEEVYKKLEEAEEDIRSGKTLTADELIGRLKEKYNV